MIDLGKVIKGLECIAQQPNGVSCGDCPYFRPFTDDPDSGWCDKVVIADDAIALLRELEPAVANWQDQTDLDDIYLSWRCSRCGHYSPTETRYTYCPYCGAKMEVKA